jgi:lipopolysaccharide export LptBFGC system permease protein LptF
MSARRLRADVKRAGPAGVLVAVDPWYDYLAIPVAPLILALQALALGTHNRRLRGLLAVGGTLAIVAMFVLITFLIPAGPGANIGAGIMLMWIACSLAILCAVAVRSRASNG